MTTTKQIKQWLARWGKSCKDNDFGYDDEQMVDDCCHDLDIKDTAGRKLVAEMVSDYIAAH